MQLSVALGTRATAAAIPLRFVQVTVTSRLPVAVVITGAVWSFTVITCTKVRALSEASFTV